MFLFLYMLSHLSSFFDWSTTQNQPFPHTPDSQRIVKLYDQFYRDTKISHMEGLGGGKKMNRLSREAEDGEGFLS